MSLLRCERNIRTLSDILRTRWFAVMRAADPHRMTDMLACVRSWSPVARKRWHQRLMLRRGPAPAPAFTSRGRWVMWPRRPVDGGSRCRLPELRTRCACGSPHNASATALGAPKALRYLGVDLLSFPRGSPKAVSRLEPHSACRVCGSLAGARDLQAPEVSGLSHPCQR